MAKLGTFSKNVLKLSGLRCDCDIFIVTPRFIYIKYELPVLIFVVFVVTQLLNHHFESILYQVSICR